MDEIDKLERAVVRVNHVEGALYKTLSGFEETWNRRLSRLEVTLDKHISSNTSNEPADTNPWRNAETDPPSRPHQMRNVVGKVRDRDHITIAYYSCDTWRTWNYDDCTWYKVDIARWREITEDDLGG